jgi:hypothetical protein
MFKRAWTWLQKPSSHRRGCAEKQLFCGFLLTLIRALCGRVNQVRRRCGWDSALHHGCQLRPRLSPIRHIVRIQIYSTDGRLLQKPMGSLRRACRNLRGEVIEKSLVRTAG